jgi:hypothetical protein
VIISLLISKQIPKRKKMTMMKTAQLRQVTVKVQVCQEVDPGRNEKLATSQKALISFC